MSSRIVRRDFLRLTVVSAFAVGAPNLGCGSDDPITGGLPPADPETTLRVFPQGVASGDPQPTSIVLWTRVEPSSADDTVLVRCQIASDAAFKNVLVSTFAQATPDSDHTVRIKITDLTPFTTYYYRFFTSEARSDEGRTKTAPTADTDTPVRFAFAACQDFVGRYYYAWKALLDQGEEIDFVLFLGDYIYETDGNPSFQTPTEQRKIVLPDGLDIGGSKAAQTLADYRALYKQFRSDPNLKRVHQSFPFVTIWDDHEFGDDCWQDHTTHFSGARGDEEVPDQRTAADRAWFEYQPADVEYHAGAGFPNDIRIYRSLRYGKHVELFLTDQRYYRSAHVVPPGPLAPDVLKISENTAVGSRIFLLKSGFDIREAAAKPTMLGAQQKQWFVDGVKQSTATWKIWGSETQLAQMVADLAQTTAVPVALRQKFYLSTDQWDGYRTERAEVLQALSGVSNLLVVTGDIHAFYASELHVDFDNPGPKPVAVEYVTAGISSFAIAPAAGNVLGANPTYKSLGLLDLIPDFDKILQAGNAHYKYANSFYNGVAICEITGDAANVRFLIIKDVTTPNQNPTPEVVHFRTQSGTSTVEVVQS